jgi:hypothetical protein
VTAHGEFSHPHALSNDPLLRGAQDWLPCPATAFTIPARQQKFPAIFVGNLPNKTLIIFADSGPQPVPGGRFFRKSLLFSLVTGISRGQTGSRGLRPPPNILV